MKWDHPTVVCLTTVSSTLLLRADLSLTWHGRPHVHTWDEGRGFGNVPVMPFCILETTVSRPAMRPHAHSTTHCVGTSWADLLDVKIRHLLFNKVYSALIPRLHTITSDFWEKIMAVFRITDLHTSSILTDDSADRNLRSGSFARQILFYKLILWLWVLWPLYGSRGSSCEGFW